MESKSAGKEEAGAARVHDLKAWPEPFAAMLSGRKTYEIRRDDRSFMVGDELRLREWDPSPWSGTLSSARGYTGRELRGLIVHKSHGGTWGLPSDLCVLGVVQLEPAAPSLHLPKPEVSR